MKGKGDKLDMILTFWDGNVSEFVMHCYSSPFSDDVNDEIKRQLGYCSSEVRYVKVKDTKERLTLDLDNVEYIEFDDAIKEMKAVMIFSHNEHRIVNVPYCSSRFIFSYTAFVEGFMEYVVKYPDTEVEIRYAI